MNNTLLKQLDDHLLDGLAFCRQVYDIFERVQTTPDGVAALRMRQGKCKQLLEELFLICKYIQCKYRPGRYISVRWKDGDQQYDAQIHSTGAHVSDGFYSENSFIEVTCVVHPNLIFSRTR